MSSKTVTGEIECPNCAETIQSTATVCRFCQKGLSEVHFKKCPYCAEMVRRLASRCRYCQSSLAGSPGISSRLPQSVPVPKESAGPRRSALMSTTLPATDKEKDVIRARLMKPIRRPKEI